MDWSSIIIIIIVIIIIIYTDCDVYSIGLFNVN